MLFRNISKNIPGKYIAECKELLSAPDHPYFIGVFSLRAWTFFLSTWSLRILAICCASRFQGCDISGDIQDILFAQVLHDGLHKLSARPYPREVLKVVQLPRKITRRASRQ